MAVRNFYITGNIGGHKTPLTGGPVRKDGGFHMTITQRAGGDIITAATIDAYANPDGELVLRVFDGEGNVALKVRTER